MSVDCLLVQVDADSVAVSQCCSWSASLGPSCSRGLWEVEWTTSHTYVCAAFGLSGPCSALLCLAWWWMDDEATWATRGACLFWTASEVSARLGLTFTGPISIAGLEAHKCHGGGSKSRRRLHDAATRHVGGMADRERFKNSNRAS